MKQENSVTVTKLFLNGAFTFDHTESTDADYCFGPGQPREAYPSHHHLSGDPTMEWLRQFIREEDGQDVVEYWLLIATIAIVVLVGISFFGNNIEAWFKTLANRITTNS